MKITNEIKAKVFAQYLGQQFRYEGSISTFRDLTGVNWKLNLESGSGENYRIDKCKLILNPLSAITDEDENELSNILSVIQPKYFIRHLEGKQQSYSLNANKTLLASQYLQSKGYDLPNYLLGGKTLQESGLAIYNP